MTLSQMIERDLRRELGTYRLQLAAAKAGRKPLAWWVAVCESEIRRLERELAELQCAGGVA